MFGWLLPLLFLALFGLIVAVVIYAVLRPQAAVSGGSAPAIRGPGDPAIEHARVRYARGELSRDDYYRIVADLGGQPPGATPWPNSPPAPPSSAPSPLPEPGGGAAPPSPES